MTVESLLEQLNNSPDTVSFEQVISTIDNHYHYRPTGFCNGVEGDQVVNDAGTNEGSCKIFSFAKLQGLNPAQTLSCFGKHYREAVLGNPDGNDHQNIRTFMRHRWDGIKFYAEALLAKD